MEPFLSEITLFSFRTVPREYHLCDGTAMPISSNTALFSLLGTTYGGNGSTNFNLPDMRGRMPMGVGNGPALPPVILGQRGGANSTKLNVANLPYHTHGVTINPAYVGGNTSSSDGTGDLIAQAKRSDGSLEFVQLPINNTKGGYTENTGSNTPIDTMSPYQCVQFCIGIQGLYPSS